MSVVVGAMNSEVAQRGGNLSERSIFSENAKSFKLCTKNRNEDPDFVVDVFLEPL